MNLFHTHAQNRKRSFIAKMSLIVMIGCFSLFPISFAESEIYGSLRFDYQNSPKDSRPSFDTDYHAQSPQKYHTQGSESLDKNRKSNIGDAGSRIGIKGKHDIGEGNAIIYNLEWGFDGVSNSAQDPFYHREAWMGISGKMGALKAGRQKNPFQQMLHDDSVLDGFNSEAIP